MFYFTVCFVLLPLPKLINETIYNIPSKTNFCCKNYGENSEKVSII